MTREQLVAEINRLSSAPYIDYDRLERMEARLHRLNVERDRQEKAGRDGNE